MPSRHTAAEAEALLTAGELTAVGLAEFYLDRIDRLNPALNAVIAVDRDAALSAAAASDARRDAGSTRGPLDGVPVMIKDNIEAVGLPCTAGSRALLNSPPRADAPLVGTMREAGLVLLGSTNLSEWANFRSTASTSGWSAVGGQTNNPYDLTRNTSGSSSGSAVAVAAGLAPLAIGTETDGSIVSPAGVCGVVGFKPTFGSVRASGIVPISSHQDTPGPMARSVAAVSALYAILCGRAVALRPPALTGLRVALWQLEPLDRALAAVMADCVARLSSAGARVVPRSSVNLNPFEDAEFDALVAEFAVELPRYLAARPGDHPRTWPELLAFDRSDEVELSKFSDEIFALAEKAPPLDSASHHTARTTANASAAQALSALLADCDFAIAPSNSPAWTTRYGRSEEFGVLTSSLAAVTGSPSVSLPAGSIGGLPVGVSVLARFGQDDAVLSFAAALEAVLPKGNCPQL